MSAGSGKPTAASGGKPARPSVASMDLVELENHYERAIKRVFMVYQPIVRASDYGPFAHEALLRCDDEQWRGPGPILTAAERLNRWPKLGRLIRAKSALTYAAEDESRGLLFLNLHAVDLLDHSLSSRFAPLTKLAHRVVLEITERASLENLVDVRNHVADLKQLGFRIAIDDLGAGAARMKDFAVSDTDFVKLDISVVRDVDSHPIKQQFVASILSMCHNQGIKVIGEGVETRPEADTLLELGCDLLQGYYLAKPGKPFPTVRDRDL